MTTGDRVGIEVGDNLYSGTIVGVNRRKGESAIGGIENGFIEVRLNLDSETVAEYDLGTDQLLVRATEEVPLVWSTPRAAMYDPREGEAGRRIGRVSNIQTQ